MIKEVSAGSADSAGIDSAEAALAALGICSDVTAAWFEQLDATQKTRIAEIVTEPVQPPRIDEALHRLRSRWAGLLTVGWDIEPAAQALLDDDIILLQWANEVIDHAVRNSSRHGGAAGLTILVSASGVVIGWLRIRIQDNGFGPGPGEVLGGSGARLVTSRQGTWVLRGRPVGGAELTVDLPGTRWSSAHFA